MNFSRTTVAVMLAGGLALLSACGGGGGNDSASAGDTTTAPAAAQITGTAATGAALANAPVTITNGKGASPCVEAAITTTSQGSYTCTLKAGESAPFFVVVTDPSGNTPPLVSVSTSTPAAGTALTLNATPLTTAIVAQLASDGNPLSVVNAGTVDAAALKAVTTNVVTQLSSVLAAIGAPAGYDPFATAITAATASNTGNTADLVLDVVKIVTDPASGKPALSTIDNPTPVVLATADSAGAAVSAPDAAVSTLSLATQITARKFTDCFAVPTAQRVVHEVAHAQADGGAEVDQVATACQDFVSDASNGGGIDFLQNGYSAGQLFYGILTSDTMTGATFSVPEIISFYPADSSATAGSLEALDRAVLNIRYLDANGNPGNQIVVAARIPGSATPDRATDWWLVGNQSPVDASPSMIVRRFEQMNAANTTRPSTFQVGFLVNVNSKGPGSIDASGTLQLARVSGPGLPGDGAAGTGLVFKVSSDASQAGMDLFNKTGSLTVGSQCGNGVTFNCPLVWLGRTAGVSGTAAATLLANPNNMLWAQAADAIDVSKFVKGARYKLELFYGSNTSTPLRTIYKTLLTDFVAPTSLANLPWNGLGPQTLAAFDPAGSLAGAQTALPLDWVQNPAAQQIGNVAAVVDNAGSFGASKPVPRGATSVVLDNSTVPAFTTSTTRSFKFNYRIQDSSSKSAVYEYN